MRPLVGITSGVNDGGLVNLNKNYCLAIGESGGIPVVLPGLSLKKTTTGDWTRNIIGNLDGLLLSGGGDVDPAYFGEEPLTGTGQINPEMDLFELTIARGALELDLPVLAICRGMQVLNIVAGGDIWQDIRLGFKRPIKHFQQAPNWYASHSIAVAKGSLLFDNLGLPQVRVNSFHHQVLRKVAPDFRVSARSTDGVIEGIESARHGYVLGVQFHPECLWRGSKEIRNLFHGFINATRVYKARRQLQAKQRV